MALSNRQKAEQYYVNCKNYIKNSLAQNTLAFSADGKVVRSELCAAINVSRAVTVQNPRIRRLLAATECWARMNKVLTAAAPPVRRAVGHSGGESDPQVLQLQARVRYMENQVAALTAENAELRKSVRRADWIDRLIDDAQGKQGAMPW